MDLEMTGLNAAKDAIVQAAVIITTHDLEVREELALDIWQPPDRLESMTPFVREMHTRTGLLDRVRQSSVDLAQAERRLLEVVAGWCPLGAVLCGNSIGQDRRFIDRWMPGLAAYLTYRMVDVTSVKLLARAWYGERASFAKPTEGEHDALVDIRNSIDELRHYRKVIFQKSPAAARDAV